MPDDDRAGEQCEVGGAVAGAVIDHDDRVSGAADAGHDTADHRRFIVRRDNDPGIANPAGHVSSTNNKHKAAGEVVSHAIWPRVEVLRHERLVSGYDGALLNTTRIASNRFTGMANRLPVGLAGMLRPSMRPTWKAISENGTNFQG
jgi:hypothetical protein